MNKKSSKCHIAKYVKRSSTLDEFINTTIIVFQAEVLKSFSVIILLLSPDKNVNLQIRGTLLKHIFRPIKYYHIARWHKHYGELAQR